MATTPSPSVAETTVAATPFDTYTVVYGYGRVPRTHHHLIDDIEFIGGIARHVPAAIAHRWATGESSSPTGTKQAGRVRVHLLPPDASEADIAKAAGLPPVPPEQLATSLTQTDMASLIQSLGGPDAARQFVTSLDAALKKK